VAAVHQPLLLCNLESLEALNRRSLPVSADRELFEFSRLRVRRRDRTLPADGQKLDLGGRAIDALLALIDAGRAMASKNDLLTGPMPSSRKTICTCRSSPCAVRLVPIGT
jgi:DNA-binding response OmpR family regulator